MKPREAHVTSDGSPDTSTRGSPRLEAESFYVDGLELVVFELELELAFPQSFTEAERDVARALCEGLGTAAIAQRRGSRYRTIANQLASMYRKAGVHSSAELVAFLTKG